MASSFAVPTPYTPDYHTSDPRKIASQQRLLAADQYNAGTGEAAAVGDYLGGIENPLAQGKGGYNASELSQIEMTPQQQQQIVTGAGISAGTGTAAAVDAANRAAIAAGGNPSAMAAYRARAARQIGQQSGDAMTQARIAASNAAAGRAENVGQTRIGQQNQALGYYGGEQQMYNANAQGAAQRGLQSSQLGLQASQTPTTFDKIMGGIGGAFSALEEGGVSSRKTPAVVGENGPEKVVQLRRGPSRSYLDDGDIIPDDLPQAPAYQPGVNAPLSLAATPNSPDYLSMTGAGSNLGTTTTNPDGSLTFNVPGTAAAQQPSFWKRFSSSLKSQFANPQQGGQAGQQRPWNPTDTYRSIGSGVGSLVKLAFLEDGGVAPDSGNEATIRRLAAHVPYYEAERLADIVNPPPAPKPAAPAPKPTKTQPQTAKPAQPMADGGIATDDIAKSLRNPKPGFGQMPQDIGAPQGTNGIFTKPTRVNLEPGEAVVPLSYRAGAKVRPRFATMPAARVHQGFRARTRI